MKTTLQLKIFLIIIIHKIYEANFSNENSYCKIIKNPPFSLSKHIEPNSNLFNGTPISKIPFNNNSKKFFFSFFKTRSDDIPDIYVA